MKTDFLFTTWNCKNCAELKSKIIENAIYDDDFYGKNKQILSIVNMFSNSATTAILTKFEFPEKAVSPVILTYDEKRITDHQEIIEYLKSQGFIKKSVKG
jgi:hypothetical protein